MFRRLRRRLLRIALVSGAGAAIAYFFDRDRGEARRAQARDQAEAFARRRRQEAERADRYAAGVAQGAAVEAQGGGVPRPEDDVEVAQLVKQALAGLDVDTTDVTVEAVDGVVTLRGQVDVAAAQTTVEAKVNGVPGVVEVRSFLHLPGTPAPNKASSLKA